MAALSSSEQQQQGQSERGPRTRRCLSIQSHVVHGYVGNKSALFPLQLHGFDVSPINSVQFSNHTGYKNGFRGKALDGDNLWDLIVGMDANGLLDGQGSDGEGAFSHVLTGYIGNASFLDVVARIICKLREKNSNLTYVCDPVMGDHGKLYVPESLVDIFSDKIISRGLCSILTPNHFELELLTKKRGNIGSMQDIIGGCDQLHSHGIGTVIVTSLNPGTITKGIDVVMRGRDGEQVRKTVNIDTDKSVILVASVPCSHMTGNASYSFIRGSNRVEKNVSKRRKLAQSQGKYDASFNSETHVRFIVWADRIDSYFTGTGDLTAALLMSFVEEHSDDYLTATTKVMAALQQVCLRTAGMACIDGDHTYKSPSRNGELRLIQSKKDLEDPPLDAHRVRSAILL